MNNVVRPFRDVLLTACRGPGGARAQADALQAEGVIVEQGGLGQYLVSFRDYGWFPDDLPDS